MGVNASTIIIFVINHILILFVALIAIYMGIQGFKIFINRNKKTEKKLDTLLNKSEVYCPKCGSTQLSANKTMVSRFASGGGFGLSGGIGARNVEITCLKCGNKFKADK